MRDSHTVVANVIVLFVKQLATWGLTTVLFLFAPRYLGDEGFGQITFASSFTGLFVVLILLGVPTYLVKEVARDRTQLGAFFFNSLMMRIPLSAMVFLIVFLSVNLMGYSPQTQMVVYLGCVTTILLCINDTASSLLQGIENMAWLSVAEVVGKLVVTGAGIFVLINGQGVVIYALVLLIGMSINLAINLSYFFVRIRVKPELDLAVWRSLLVGGLPFLLTSIMATLYQRMDATILRFLTTEAVVGWYGAAAQLLGSLNFVPILVATAVLPALSRMHAANPRRLTMAARKSLSMIIAVSLPMMVGTVLLSDKIIEFLRFPEAFQNSVPLLAILAIDLPLTGTLVVIGTVVIAQDKQRQWAILTAVSVAVNLVMNLIGIPLAQELYGNGAIGAAAASVVSEAFQMLLAVRMLPGGILDRSVLQVFAKSVVASVLMGIVVWYTRGLEILVVVTLGIVVYCLVSLITKSIENEDLMLVRDVILKRRMAVNGIREVA